MNCLKTVLPALLLCTGSIDLAAQAQEQTIADRPVRCLNLTRVRSTEIISTNRIVFRTTGNKYFLNTLSHACPGLSTRKAFMYRTSLNQVCDLDTITVLEDIGFGFSPGATCGLGRFYPIEAQDVVDMKAAAKQRHNADTNRDD